MFDHSKQDSDISFILGFVQDIKHSIFKAIYMIMQQDEHPLYKSIFFAIIQISQLIYLKFGSRILYIWNNDQVADIIYNVFKYTSSISIHLKGLGLNAYIAVFYTFFGMVILAYVLIIIFAFTFRMATVPLLILKILLQIFLHLGFAPMMLLFFGVLYHVKQFIACDPNDKGISSWTYNPEIECWGSVHLIHGIMAIVAICLFQILVGLTALIYFESKPVQGDTFAQRSGRPYSFYHINVFLIIMSYQLLEVPRFIALQFAIFTLSSFFLFYYIHIEKPFYNKIVQKMWSIVTALNLWTSIMQVFAYLLEGIYFKETIYGWMGGIPLIILIIVNESIFEVDLLSANINRATSGQQVILLCEYLLVLLDSHDQHSSLMLDGYMEIHRQTCPRADCVSKVKKQLSDQNKHINLQDFERNQIFIEVINQVYYDGIKQFPQDVVLRLNYSYFLIDRLKLKQQALTELQQAEQSGPSFDHEFIIYRYKRIMEDDLQEQQQDNLNQVDLVTEIAFQTQSKHLIQQIEKTSLIYIDFWNQLQEEIPDIGKLNDLGFKILDSANEVQEQWSRLKRLNQKASKLNRLMGKYYSQVLNDDESGQKLIQQSRLNVNDRFKAVDLEDIQNEQLPTIAILTELDKLGTISNVNKAACSLLGYAKTDLINRKLSLIQPDIIAKYHDHFLENFLDQQSENYAGIITKDRGIFAKTKQGYIVPCQLNIRMFQTMNQGVFMCSSLKQEISHRAVSILICQPSGIIENINASCIKMFGLELRAITFRPVNILDIFPDLFDRKEEFLQKNGGILNYTSGTRSSKNNNSLFDLDIEHSQQLDNQIQSPSLQYQCYLSEIKFTCIDDQVIQNQIHGYVVKLERIHSSNEKSKLDLNLKPKSNPFQFRYNFQSKAYVMDLYTGQESQDVTMRVDQSILWEDQTKISQQILSDAQQLAQPEEQNYGEGIRVVRLIGDKIMDIDEIKSDNQSEDENLQSVFAASDSNQDNKANEKDTINLYRSKSQLEALLKSSKTPKTAKSFRVFINICALLIATLLFVEYFLNTSFDTELENSLPLISQNNKRMSAMMTIQSLIQDLQAINNDWYPLFKDPVYGYSELEKQYRLWLNIEINNLINLQKELTLVSDELDSEFSQYEQEYLAKGVQMFDKTGNTQNYTYNEAIQSLIAKSLAINSTTIDEINDQNGDVYYLEYNMFNNLLTNLEIPANYFKYNTESKSIQLQHSLVAFFAIALLLLFLQVIFITLFLIKLQVVNQNALELFMNLNDRKVKAIYYKCENFITSLQVGEDDDEDVFEFLNQFQSDIEDKDEDIKEKDESDHLLNGRKKRKKFKNSNHQSRRFMMILFCSGVIVGYYLYLYLSTQVLTENSTSLRQVFNLTSFVECYYRFGDNVLRKSLEVEDYQFIGMTSEEMLSFLILTIQSVDAEIHQIHSFNQDILSSDYLDVFNNIFILSPCEYIVAIDTTITYETCTEFNEGVLQQGLSIGMAKYFENFRQLSNQYTQYNSSLEYEEKYNISTDKRINYMMNMVNTYTAHNMRLMQERYIRGAYFYLIQVLEDSIKTQFRAFLNLRAALFMSCNAFLFVIYFLIWIPLVFRMLHDMIKIRLMLTIIPLPIIQKTPSIRQYIRKVIIP